MKKLTRVRVTFTLLLEEAAVTDGRLDIVLENAEMMFEGGRYPSGRRD